MATIVCIILACVPLLLILFYGFFNIFVGPRIDKKAEQRSNEEFERDWNQYMVRRKDKE